MPVIVRNPSVDPATLPYPLRGVVRGGSAVILSTSITQLLAICPTITDRFKLEEAHAQSYDDSTHGPVLGYAGRRIVDGTAYTVKPEDWGRVLYCSNASPQVITVDDSSVANVPDDAVLLVVREGAGSVTIAGSGGVTADSALSLVARAQKSQLSLMKRSATLVYVGGDMT